MRWLYLLSVAWLVAACGGGSPTAEPPAQPPSSACPLPQQQLAVGGFMARNYFWHEQLGPGDASAPTIAQYFDSLLYKPTDRYSFSEPQQTFEQRVEQGMRVGFGYTLAWTDARHTALRVRSVEPLSPAGLAGLRRGQTIAAIDGYSLQDIDEGKVPSVTRAGVARTIVLHDPAGGGIPINMVSAVYPLTVVPATATFTVTRNATGDAVPVGYLAYQSFVAHANEDLAAAVRSFAAAGVRELVLDLRYNGGGSVAVSRDLASMIGGGKVANSLYAYLRFNENNLVKNQSVLFRPDAFALPAPALQGVERLIVLTSPATASASELVINGLKPFMSVVLIGGATYGKPYGSIVQHHCGTTYHAIQFTSLNALGTADFASGFTPDCAVNDDLDHELGDAREARLAAALRYVQTGQCPAPALVRQARPAPTPQRPSVLGEVDPPVMTLESP